MKLKDNGQVNDERPENKDKPNAYRVDDDSNLEEKDLKKSYLFGDAEEKDINKPGMEGTGMGGQSFGQNNITPAGNDEANPSQLTGNNNQYFNRTQPAEEHPEDSNFTAPDQTGGSNNQATDNSKNEEKDENSKNDQNNAHPHPQQPYREGTADDDGNSENKQTNIPGPNEVPDQQKVGE